MFDVIEQMRRLDPASRREFLETAARAMLGVSVLPIASTFAADTPKGKPAPSGKPVSAGGAAKHVIYLYMQGAMTHLDTFDLKPGRETQGQTKGIATNVPGMQISEFLPSLAKVTDKMAIIRSMSTETGDHEGGRYLIKTSFKQIASIRHPTLGSWAMELLGKRQKTLPDNVTVAAESTHPGAGFMPPSFSPLPIDNPADGLQNTKTPAYLTKQSFGKRMELVNKFDSAFRQKYDQKQVEAYNEFYKQAITLLSSEELKAFDIKVESDDMKTAYGANRFGQGCLLARRLVENDVRFVEVNFGSWDHHTDIYDNNRMPQQCRILDQAMGQLITDLTEKGLIKNTMIVLATEFGRTPRINQNNGRDHHPGAFSCVLAGAGIKGGQFYGKSDKDGFSVEDDGVSVNAFNATIARAMGMPTDKEVFSPSGRPFTVSNKGTAVAKLLS